MAYGTLTTLDTLATLSNTTVADFGEDNVYNTIDSYLTAHNGIMDDMMGDLVERSTDRLRRYGGQSDMEMYEADEMGTPDAQKISVGDNVGFPLRLYDGALQWTRMYFKNAMVSEIAAQFNSMLTADVRNVQRQIKRALMYSANVTFTDKLIDGVSLPVKRLVNADSASIPTGPNGETFDGSTHTHLLARAGGSLAASDVTSLIATVVEHFNQGTPVLYINRAQETAIRGFTSNFVPYYGPTITPGSTVTVARGVLDDLNLNNRAIGMFNQAEVWIKPWVPASYLFAFLKGAPKPLVMRTRNANSGNLELVYEDENHPLRARTYQREFGVGVWTRTNGAVLYSGNTSYTQPTIS